ncbi:hypothetical protein [Perlabentimonas gracilis]|uniref:hypothetical protein n=1 Tax=Perlabentimonas gracilis TaxID=2715279 RepID=UPI00140B908E|nr:hypothetical protein [Perlabentimonas gracilis]NHB70374.1 hypothetical protein [Perlabentimonas gracilis]
MTQKEKDELNAIYRNQAEEPMKQLKTKIIKWYPLEISNIGVYSTIKVSYIRQMETEKPVYVVSYNFFNYNEIVEITLSYRLEDESIWKDDFQEIIKSFKFLKLN